MLGDRVYCYRSKCFDLHKQKTVEKGYYMRKIILASASPRRRELLAAAGVIFQVCAADGEEKITSDKPEEIVRELSEQKATAVALNFDMEEGTVVIGADTIIIMKSSENRSMSPMHLRHLKCFREIYIRYIQG